MGRLWFERNDRASRLVSGHGAWWDALQTANDAVKPDLDIALNRMRQTLPAALIPYHVAVAAYNDALAMRPASWLARRLNLKPAMRMDLSMGAA